MSMKQAAELRLSPPYKTQTHLLLFSFTSINTAPNSWKSPTFSIRSSSKIITWSPHEWSKSLHLPYLKKTIRRTAKITQLPREKIPPNLILIGLSQSHSALLFSKGGHRGRKGLISAIRKNPTSLTKIIRGISTVRRSASPRTSQRTMARPSWLSSERTRTSPQKS